MNHIKCRQLIIKCSWQSRIWWTGKDSLRFLDCLPLKHGRVEIHHEEQLTGCFPPSGGMCVLGSLWLKMVQATVSVYLSVDQVPLRVMNLKVGEWNYWVYSSNCVHKVTIPELVLASLKQREWLFSCTLVLCNLPYSFVAVDVFLHPLRKAVNKVNFLAESSNNLYLLSQEVN